MSTTWTTNFHRLSFDHKHLTRTVGKLSFAMLHILLLHLNSNASSAPSILGEGQYGYVVVILSPITYTTLAPMQPLIPPVHPSILNMVQPTTQYEIALIKTLHNEGVRNFQSYQLIQRALFQQLLESVEDKYSRTLRKQTTVQVPSDIRNLILHLFRVYGKITPQQLKSNYDTVEQVQCSIDEPIDVLFLLLDT